MRIADLRMAARLYGGFGATVLLVAVLVTIGSLNFSKLSNANAINTHTYQVLGKAGELLESPINMETGERGYVITGVHNSLEPYNKGKEAFAEQLGHMRVLTSDHPAQQQRLEQPGAAQQAWLAGALDPVIVMRLAVAQRRCVGRVLTHEQAV